MLSRFLLLLILCNVSFGYAQKLAQRVIFIGDAGEINHLQESIIDKAVELVKKDSTLVFFLGDNIYPSGMPLEKENQENAKLSLEAQYKPFRKKNVPVYFLAGNHDWNVSRRQGLERLKVQEEYLKNLGDSNIRLMPIAGEPGPVAINITPTTTFIVYDSEYWLYPFHPESINLEEKRTTFKEQLDSIVSLNKDKSILILSHHPMRTYGEHSLSFGWKQHIFPLTRLNKKLYIPLPIIGSIFPLWRGLVFKSAEDLPHSEYQKLVNTILSSTSKHSHIAYVAGHDHGLQYIVDKDLKQVVSGSGSKSSFIGDHENLKFKYESQGFCISDIHDDGSVAISYYTFENGTCKLAYQTKLINR